MRLKTVKTQYLYSKIQLTVYDNVSDVISEFVFVGRPNNFAF